MSSDCSHKRRRLSQREVRAAFASHSVSSDASSLTNQGDNNSIAKTTPNESATQDNPSSIQSTNPVPLSLAVHPYQTPQASRLPNSRNDPNYTRPEPATFLDSATATSSISSGPSSTRTPRFNALPPPVSTIPGGVTEPGSNGADASNAPSQKSRLSSSSFNLYHRCNSIGLVEFGTQSSPPKSSNLLRAIEASKDPSPDKNAQRPVNQSNNDDDADHPTATNDTVPTAVAPPPGTVPVTGAVAPSPSTTGPNTTDTTDNTQSTESLERLGSGLVRRGNPSTILQPQVQYPNLKVQIKKIQDGSFLFPLRRQPSLKCNNPGDSTKNHPPMIVVATSPDKRCNLSLVANYCGPLMRKAKNYTMGVTRSSAGITKQRRYNKTSNKRKHVGSSDTVDTEDTAEDEQSFPSSVQMVTSFGLRTMLLEDFWFLKIGTPVALFFNAAILPPRYAKKWSKVLRDTSQSNYVPSVLFEGRSYHQLTGWVLKNPDLRHVTDAQLYKHIVDAMNEHLQYGTHFKFPIFSSDNCQFTTPPTDCIGECLTWFKIFNYPQGVFVQADYHPERTWSHIFKRVKEDGGERLTLLHRLIQETPGDRFMLAELKSVWERLQIKQMHAEANEKHNTVLAQLHDARLKADEPPPPIIDGSEQVKKFCEHIDRRLWDRMEECFGRFNNIFEKFLSEHETREMVTDFEKYLPDQFNTLMALSGYTKKVELAPSKERAFLRQRFSLDVFFQFIIRARKHNNHALVSFGMLFALAQYACGHPLFATQIPVWIGLAVSKRTMERRVEPWLQSYDTRVRQALRNVTSLLCVFDNLQDGRRLAFQQGQSSMYTRVTARFVMSMYIARFPSWVYTFLERPKLTYIQQAIPGAYQMPAFESSDLQFGLVDTLNSIFRHQFPVDSEPSGNPFDCSGTRVRIYQQIIAWCREIQHLKRFLSTKRRPGYKVDYTLQPPEFSLNHARANIASALRGLRKNRESNIFEVARQFPIRVVHTWRHTPPVAELLILPVSVLDETTKTGAAGIILDFMVLHGLLQWDETNELYRHGQKWEDKWLFVVGDGLSIDRMFQFFDDVMAITDAKVASFRTAYRQAITISQVLHRVVPINGDLHVRFHMLDAIYRLFYGGFLQCMQHRLKWKRIDGGDVSKSYRLAHRLAILVYEEVDRIMLDVFILRCVSEEKVDEYVHHNKQELLAVYLAKEYLLYLNKQVRESRDWLHRYLCNFLLIVRKYMTFLQGEQQGDALAMESAVVEYLPIFYATKKTNSFNTQLRLMELYYNRIPISILQQIRINRTKHQKARSNKYTLYPKESALDQIMERLMPFFKSMNHNGTEASFVRVSQMLTACQRAKQFVQFYTRGRGDGEYELAERFMESAGIVDDEEAKEKDQVVDPCQSNKTTTIPNNRLNRVLVTEVLLKAKCHEVRNESNVVVDKNVFWRALDSTQLQVQKKHHRCGNGRVENDATHEFVMVKVSNMIPSKSASGTARDRDDDSQHSKGSALAEDGGEDDTTEIDLAEAMKEQDDEGSTGDRSYFSDDDVAVIDIEDEAFAEGNETNVTIDEDEHDNEDEGERGITRVNSGEVDEPETQFDETQVEDFLADEANETEALDGEEDVDEGDGEDEGEDDGSNGKKCKVNEKEEENETAMPPDNRLLQEKKRVKGMKIVELNVLATKDLESVALEEMGEKNVIAGKEWEAARKEREHHFLRYKLFARLEDMEKEGPGLGWSNRSDSGTLVGNRLDRSVNIFKKYKFDCQKDH